MIRPIKELFCPQVLEASFSFVLRDQRNLDFTVVLCLAMS